LASVSTGGGGGGAAPAAGGAATGGPAAPEEKVEEKVEGKFLISFAWGSITDIIYREGRVRRGYGFRSFRLSNLLTLWWTLCSRLADKWYQGFWKKLCGLYLSSFACHEVNGLGFYESSREKVTIMHFK